MLAKILTGVLFGIDEPVEVEVDAQGCCSLQLPAVKESKKRINSAIKNPRYDFPAGRI